MSVDVLLSRLEGVKPTGPGRWIARCPAHDDRRASFAIRELPDGRVLAHCFAGCAIQDVLDAAGLEMSALFPEQGAVDGTKAERWPFAASDVLRAVAHEAMIASIALADIAAGKALSETDLARLRVAATRLRAAAEEFS
jgi:hypothetical protein